MLNALQALDNLTNGLSRLKGNRVCSDPSILLTRVVSYYDGNVLGKKVP